MRPRDAKTPGVSHSNSADGRRCKASRSSRSRATPPTQKHRQTDAGEDKDRTNQNRTNQDKTKQPAPVQTWALDLTAYDSAAGAGAANFAGVSGCRSQELPTQIGGGVRAMGPRCTPDRDLRGANPEHGASTTCRPEGPNRDFLVRCCVGGGFGTLAGWPTCAYLLNISKPLE